MKICGLETEIRHLDAVVVGSGCAGLSSVLWLWELGKKDCLLVTDGLKKGTSRNAGSDKQTYYKLSLSGEKPDSVWDMARDLFEGGMNGDTALAEAASSLRAFFRLVELGVPFPTNTYGEYVGYQTDHDLRLRATSAGPLTSRMMTEALEKKVFSCKIPVLDGVTVFSVLKEQDRVRGVLGYEKKKGRLIVLLSPLVILATGGPANVYANCVYPLSQTGMSGMAIRAGLRMANLHQWQYGLASVKFRWNVSGSYQQVLPRYVSVDAQGVEREFLPAYFETPLEAVQAVFLKGYQWPFDVKKVEGSSRVDLAVHRENTLGRRVYMDFSRNPSCLKADLSNLAGEAKAYLTRTGALQETPFARLMHMNAPAVQLYLDHQIILEKEMLEVRVCAQHHNGGIAVDANWQTNLQGLYAVGEAAGTFGAYRPGGMALGSTQVGSLRASQHAAKQKIPFVKEAQGNLTQMVEKELQGLNFSKENDFGTYVQEKMSLYGAHLRNPAKLACLERAIDTFLAKAQGPLPMDLMKEDLEERVRLRDQLMIQKALIQSICYAAGLVGSSGAGLVLKEDGTYLQNKQGTAEKNAILYWDKGNCSFLPPRPLPQSEQVFETVWKAYREENGQNA